MDKIAVLGIGRLGLCFALNLEKKGFEVWGIDNNETYVNELKSKNIKSNEPQLEDYLTNSSSFYPSIDVGDIIKNDIRFIYILVPTPSSSNGSFSHDIIDKVINELLGLTPNDDRLRHIIIGSTVMPGYCDQLAEKVHSKGYTVTYNPEFIAQGSIIYDQQNPDQLLIGEGHEEGVAMLKNIYSKICDSEPSIHVMNRKSAELTKLATNCFLTMKISFANAIGDLASETGGEPEKILAAIGSDSRIGDKYLKYGYGFGGPCFPRDNQALLNFSEYANLPFHLSRSTVQVNNEHFSYQLKKMLDENRKEYTFEYITYKKETDIIEESQQLLLAVELVKAGKKVVLKNSNHIKQKLEAEFPNYFTFI